jgi:hypothetical protein
VDLVVHEVVQLQHVHHADRDVLIEDLTGTTVEQDRLRRAHRPAARRGCPISLAPSNTGVAMCTPLARLLGHEEDVLIERPSIIAAYLGP